MGEARTHHHAGAITFRPIRPEDADFLYEVYASTRQDMLAALGWTAAQGDAFLRMQFHAQDQSYRTQFPNADFLIVLLQERPIGRLYVERRADEILGIDIPLLPAYRQAGIGTAILHDLFAEAARVGKPFRFHVEKMNVRARRLYERLGCTVLTDDGMFLFMEWVPD